jgi:ATP-dependent protease ClpP protease subunit
MKIRPINRATPDGQEQRPENALPWYSIKAKAEESDTTEIFIYDEIGYWGITANDFVQDLNKIESKNITIHLNCPGGSVFDGVAMMNALKQHEAHVTVNIQGLCASIATVIALSADKVIMAKHAFFMIHEAWTWAYGRAEDLEKTASLLKDMNNTIAGVYHDKTDIPVDELLQMMKDETWLTCEDCIEKGFVDEEAGADTADEPENEFDLSEYKNVPEALKCKEPAPDVHLPPNTATMRAKLALAERNLLNR